ncbi:hypothetical protein C8R45DRAFT_795940, partial [Mycena sanguinolenta]
KVSRSAIEQSQEKRDNYEATVGDLYHDWQLVFLDESHCDHRTMQRRGSWGQIVYSLVNADGFRYSVLPAISLDGVLHLDIITRSWTAEEFEQYIYQ